MEGIRTVLMMPILLVFYSVAVIVGVTTEVSTIFYVNLLFLSVPPLLLSSAHCSLLKWMTKPLPLKKRSAKIL